MNIWEGSQIIIRKKAQIIWLIVCAMMLLLTVFLVTLSIMFSGGRNAAEFFGSNLYLVRSDAFTLIPAPSVVIGERVAPAELNPGHIVIFETSGGRTSIGEITEVGVEVPGDPEQSEQSEQSEESEESEGSEQRETVYFLLTDESGQPQIVAGEAIVARAARTSRFLGFLFNFAASSAGVLVIAVIPCIVVIAGELLKPLFKRRIVAPVNKQDESPTFIPVGKSEPPKIAAIEPIAPAIIAPEPDTVAAEPAKAAGRDVHGAAISKPQSPLVFPQKQSVNYAALKAYKDTLNAASPEQVSEPAPELITAPEQVAPPPAPNNNKKRPLSSVKLAEVIAAANREREEREEREAREAHENHKQEEPVQTPEEEEKPWVMPKRGKSGGTLSE
jgi:hypothetical protein